ncbi:MAG: hypothetical protein JXA77_07840 [Bacteroidales bacterium]|nr:hypothetical protein [Bacteroidales bacterium]MBN2819523.1 hypothetical protein [Bacteroidales bacterium]
MKEMDQDYLSNRYYSVGKKKESFFKRWRFGRRFARRTKRILLKTMKGMGKEAEETRDMAQSFFKLLESKLDLQQRKTPPSKEEIKAALEQLMDVGRFSFFASISLLPGGGLSLIGLEILARKFGLKNFTFVPSSFRKKNRIFHFRSYGKSKENQIEEN